MAASSLGSIKRSLTIGLLLSAIFISCNAKQELISDLKREELVDVLMTLNAAKIPYQQTSTKTRSADTFTVAVDPADYLAALTLLKKNGLLREETNTFDDITKQQGFIPNSQRIEQLRQDRALALDLERLLHGVTGIVDVRASIRTIKDGLRTDSEKRTATVVVRYLSKSGVQPFSNDELIKIASSSIPNLPAEAITISTFRMAMSSDDDRISPGHVSPDLPSAIQTKLWLVVVAALMMMLAIGAMLGFVLRDRAVARPKGGGDNRSTMMKLPVVKF